LIESSNNGILGIIETSNNGILGFFKFRSTAKKELMDFGSRSNNSVKRLKFRRLTKIIITNFDQLKSVKKFGQLIIEILIK
jgi:hypothetical protein